MAYQFQNVTIRTTNTMEGMKKINELWADIVSGKIPLLFDSEHRFQPGISAVSKYSNYASDETGEYDLSVMAVTSVFFQEMEALVNNGEYKKYDVSGEEIASCAQKAWEQVWGEQKTGEIARAFSEDFESTVPAEYTKDGKAHCYLYIAIQ